MIREIVKPEGNTYVLKLPDDMVGKTVEVIAFEIEEKQKPMNDVPVKKTIEQLREEVNSILGKYEKYPKISHQDYKFDRDEANDYE